MAGHADVLASLAALAAAHQAAKNALGDAADTVYGDGAGGSANETVGVREHSAPPPPAPPPFAGSGDTAGNTAGGAAPR